MVSLQHDHAVLDSATCSQPCLQPVSYLINRPSRLLQALHHCHRFSPSARLHPYHKMSLATVELAENIFEAEVFAQCLEKRLNAEVLLVFYYSHSHARQSLEQHPACFRLEKGEGEIRLSMGYFFEYTLARYVPEAMSALPSIQPLLLLSQESLGD